MLGETAQGQLRPPSCRQCSDSQPHPWTAEHSNDAEKLSWDELGTGNAEAVLVPQDPTSTPSRPRQSLQPRTGPIREGTAALVAVETSLHLFLLVVPSSLFKSPHLLRLRRSPWPGLTPTLALHPQPGLAPRTNSSLNPKPTSSVQSQPSCWTTTMG